MTDSDALFLEPTRPAGRLARLRDRVVASRSRRAQQRMERLRASTADHVHPAVLCRSGEDPMTVIAEFDARNGLDADSPTGRLTTLHRLPVGLPLRLELSDGRRGIVVVVADNGRFCASGPIY